MCIYVCVWGCLDKYISVATWPPQTKIPGSAPGYRDIFSHAQDIKDTARIVTVQQPMTHHQSPTR